MKISPSVIRTIALSAGIVAGISSAYAEDQPAPAKERSAAPAANGKVAAKPAGNEAEARALFLRHDTNKDGKLSMEEFDKAFDEIRGEPQLAQPPNLRPVDPCPGCGMG